MNGSAVRKSVKSAQENPSLTLISRRETQNLFRSIWEGDIPVRANRFQASVKFRKRTGFQKRSKSRRRALWEPEVEKMRASDFPRESRGMTENLAFLIL